MARPADTVTLDRESNRRHPGGSDSEYPRPPAGPGPQSIHSPAFAVLRSPTLQVQPPGALPLFSGGDAHTRKCVPPFGCSSAPMGYRRWKFMIVTPSTSSFSVSIKADPISREVIPPLLFPATAAFLPLVSLIKRCPANSHRFPAIMRRIPRQPRVGRKNTLDPRCSDGIAGTRAAAAFRCPRPRLAV